MIDLVAKLLNVITSSIHNVFLFASLIGRVIVTISATVMSSTLSLFNSLFYFFQIIYEDNILILIEEVPNILSNALADIGERWLYLNNFISAFCGYVYYKTNNTVITLVWVLNSVSTMVIEVLYLVKKFFILFGDSLWLILTFIPVHLPLLVKSGIVYIKNIVVSFIVDSYMVLLQLTNFLTDVPIESFIGITSAFVIIRVSIHFREYIKVQAILLYWSLIRKLLYLYHTIYNYCTDSEVRVITRMASDQTAENQTHPDNAIDDHGDSAEALCVVCQERQKCVLILPCRHVCLCRDCCIRLYGYQRTCPICRTFIYHSVNIYL